MNDIIDEDVGTRTRFSALSKQMLVLLEKEKLKLGERFGEGRGTKIREKEAVFQMRCLHVTGNIFICVTFKVKDVGKEIAYYKIRQHIC